MTDYCATNEEPSTIKKKDDDDKKMEDGPIKVEIDI